MDQTSRACARAYALPLRLCERVGCGWPFFSPAHDSALRDEVVEKMREAFGARFGLFGTGWGEGSQVVPCRVVQYSDHGAVLVVPVGTFLPMTFMLRVQERLQPGQVVMRRPGRLHVSFTVR